MLRIAGSAMEIWVPVKNILAIFSKETGQGVIFETIPKSEQESGQQSEVSKNNSIGKDYLVMVEPPEEPEKDVKKRKPTVGRRKNTTFLKRVK